MVKKRLIWVRNADRAENFARLSRSIHVDSRLCKYWFVVGKFPSEFEGVLRECSDFCEYTHPCGGRPDASPKPSLGKKVNRNICVPEEGHPHNYH